MAKRAQVVPIAGYTPADHAAGPALRAKENEALEFWQRRSRNKLTPAAAREIGKNIRGLIDLLERWDREERDPTDSAVTLRETDDDAKD